MATFFKRKHKKGWNYFVQVRRKGIKTFCKTFATRTEAKRWARQMETKLDRGDYSDYSEASKVTLGDLFKRYINEGKHKHKKGWRIEEYKVGTLLKDSITDTNLIRLSTKHISEFRDRRVMQVSPTTYNKDLSFISVVINTAMHDWGIYLPHNPCRLVKREKEPNPRDRILADDEYQRLMKACSSANRYLKPMINFSIETAIRKGELLAMHYEHINFEKRTLLIPETKTGKPRTIPLSPKAIQILQSQPRRLDGKVFPLSVDSLKAHWVRARKKAKLSGFRFHDLRRTACSLLFEKGLSVPSVQLISGHADPTVLLNTYTKLSAEKIALELEKVGNK